MNKAQAQKVWSGLLGDGMAAVLGMPPELNLQARLS
jgi:hypothetical protein